MLVQGHAFIHEPELPLVYEFAQDAEYGPLTIAPGCGDVCQVLTHSDECHDKDFDKLRLTFADDKGDISDGVCLWQRSCQETGIADTSDQGVINACINQMIDAPPNSCDKFSTQYTAAFYWSIVTLTTLGYGDIGPANHDEKLFCTFAMLMGASIFAYSVTNMCTLVHNLNPAEVYYRTRRDELNDYLDFLHTPKALRQKVQDYYNFKVQRSDVVVYNQDMILMDMSTSMKGDIKFFILGDLLLQCPFFATENPAEIPDGKKFLSAIATRLGSAPMATTELVVTEGDIATKMYLIAKGAVKQMQRNSEGVEESIGELHENSIFGVVRHHTAQHHTCYALIRKMHR